VTGPLADVGLACRLGVQLAVDAINGGGGIASLGGARLELVVGDSGSAAGPRAEAERVIAAGACALTGAFHSGHTAAIAAVARLRRTPFLVDTAVADAATLAASDPTFVFRNFPTTSAFARRAMQYIGEVFGDAQRPVARVALMHTTDALGTTQARRVEAAYTAVRPAFELLEFVPVSPRATGVTSEMSRLRASAPDVLLLAVRPSIVGPLFRHLARDPLPVAATVSLGTPDLASAARAAGVSAAAERAMELAPWPNPRHGRTQRLAEEFVKRSGGRPLDAAGGYAYEAIVVLANALERAASLETEAIAEALRRTSYASPLMVAAGPVTFDATGENPNASPALLQIFGGRPAVVWPRAAAERPYALAPGRP
jgi:branched-chain amino acid transport system substrate-binding protein